MPEEPQLTPLQRRDRALVRLQEGRRALRQALEGIDPEDAFLGSRWSVWEVLKHLDAENFVDALEKISTGAMEMLPPFSSREDHLRKDIEHLEATYDRLQAVIEGLSEEQLALPVTPPNPVHSFPGLTMLELVERSAGHAGTHARQVELTRKYVAEFNARDRTVTILALGNDGAGSVPAKVQELVPFADYTAGDAASLELVRPWIRGLEAEIRTDNIEEIVSRMAREARAGLWTVICVPGSNPETDHPTLLNLARQHCEKVVIVT
ncbi:MAG: DinB family protein [Chloroflexi bacterium]|nr:DinB family protein [Chloroflexota bacterium]